MLREAVHAHNDGRRVGDPCMLVVGLGRNGASLVHPGKGGNGNGGEERNKGEASEASNVRRARRGGADVLDLEECGRA
jgi:hypothetical protein